MYKPQDIFSFRNLNPKNKTISQEWIDNIFHKLNIDVKINDLALFQRAFIHTSYIFPDDKMLSDDKIPPPDAKELESFKYIKTDEMPPIQTLSYESLEFLGDSILNSIVVSYTHKRYRKEKEGEQGFLTDLKNKLIRGTLLCILAKLLKFNQYIMISRNQEILRLNDSVLEDVFEAFVGALFIDQGEKGPAYGICQQFIVTLMEKYLDFGQIIHRRDNYKAQLLEYYHSHFYGADPKYQLVSKYGPTYDRIFRCAVLNIDGIRIATGEGTKKTSAEQEAAKNALKYFGEDVYSDSEAPDKEVFSDSESE
jgi:ribonuclease-3